MRERRGAGGKGSARSSRAAPRVPGGPPRRATYTELKRDATIELVRLLRSATGEMPGAPWFAFSWFENERHRDKDGVAGLGRKFVLDAIVKARLLPNDGNKVIGGFFSDTFTYEAGWGVKALAYALVGTHDVAKPVWSCWFPMRLPDLNEAIAGARLDGTLHEREAAKRRWR